MFYELNNFVGKALVVGVLFAAGVYGVSKLGGWCEQYREMGQKAKESMGEIEPWGPDGLDVDMMVREQKKLHDAWQHQYEEKWSFELGNPEQSPREERRQPRRRTSRWAVGSELTLGSSP